MSSILVHTHTIRKISNFIGGGVNPRTRLLVRQFNCQKPGVRR